MQISDHVLRCFLTLVETRQFTVAADRCHVSQSALSQMISRLEERVGVRLFERDSRSVAITSEGERLAESARRITSELDHALADLRDVASLHAGQVSLAVLPSLAVRWVPEILRKFRQRSPQIRLQLHDVSSARCLELVRQGLVDFALNSLPGAPSEVHADLLFEEALYVICPKKHPLVATEAASLRALRDLPFIHLKGTSDMMVRTGKRMRVAKQVLQEAGIVDTGLEVGNLATQAGLVAAGFGVCLCPESSLPQFSLLPTAAVRIEPKSMIRPIYCIRRRSSSLPPAAQALCDSIAASSPQPAPLRA